MHENIKEALGLALNGTKTEPISGAQACTLSAAELEELKQLAFLFAELDREFGESDDPDLRFAMAFARQCAMGDLSAD
jgi:hypothetical protein